jgi:hypothetical protein
VAGVPVTVVRTTVGPAEGPVAVVPVADIRAPVPTRVAATVDAPETVPMAVAREDVPEAPAGRPGRPGGNVRQPPGVHQAPQEVVSAGLGTIQESRASQEAPFFREVDR